MVTFPEFILMVLSFGAWNPWSHSDESAYHPENSVDVHGAPELKTESRSLYDLMAHFPKDEDITCPGRDSRFRYPGSCSRYVTCRRYEAHIRSCPPGMSFDVNSGHCRLAFEVDCDDDEDILRFRSTCGPDQEYSDCKCEKTCENFLEEDICGDHCTTGCFCRMGLVRDIDGNCVLPEACENSLFSAFKWKKV